MPRRTWNTGTLAWYNWLALPQCFTALVALCSIHRESFMAAVMWPTTGVGSKKDTRAWYAPSVGSFAAELSCKVAKEQPRNTLNIAVQQDTSRQLLVIIAQQVVSVPRILFVLALTKHPKILLEHSPGNFAAKGIQKILMFLLPKNVSAIYYCWVIKEKENRHALFLWLERFLY